MSGVTRSDERSSTSTETGRLRASGGGGVARSSAGAGETPRSSEDAADEAGAEAWAALDAVAATSARPSDLAIGCPPFAHATAGSASPSAVHVDASAEAMRPSSASRSAGAIGP